MVTLFYAPSLIRIITRSSSDGSMRTAQILSICVLLLSITPFASLFLFLSTIQKNPQLLREVVEIAFGKPSTTNNDQDVDTTMEEYNEKMVQLVWDILSPRHNPRQYIPYLPPRVLQVLHNMESASEKENASSLQSQIPALLTIILPTAVSIILGIIIPSIGLMKLFWNRRIHATKKKQHRDELVAALSKHHLRLEERHRTRTTDKASIERIGVVEENKWRIPISNPLSVDETESIQNNPTSQQLHRLISEPCSVCLTPYELGDDIVWSENPDCIHVFHHSCMLSWLMKRPNRSRQLKPCPNCRQAFLNTTKSS
jgi:hypothetical protein